MSLNKSEHENHRIPQDAQIAQLVEQRTENPRVTGSIPVLGIIGSSDTRNKNFSKKVKKVLDNLD